ncbi:MAG: lytic transglycosylase domain-containing protein [Planctomycetota bacterium]|jgi:soluble lytic murein transglycosylase-like protein
MHQDELTLMKDLQSRQVEMQQHPLSPRRRAFVWAAAVLGLIGAIAILAIQRERANQDLRGLIESAAKRHGLDPDLVEAVVYAESKGNPEAVSKAQAYGLMQLQVPTATDMAGRPVSADDLLDSALNLDLGCKYLVWLGQRLEGDLKLVLMAYNAGYGNVKKWRKKSASTDEILEKHAFSETRAYVHKVLGFREAIKNEG